MSWFGGRGRQRAVMERLGRLDDRLEAIATRSDEFAEKLTRLEEDRAEEARTRREQADEIEAVRRDIAELSQNAEQHQAMIAEIAEGIEASRQAAMRHGDLMNRLRTDLMVLSDQARIDLAEYRETTTAIALAMLPAHTPIAMSPAPPADTIAG